MSQQQQQYGYPTQPPAYSNQGFPQNYNQPVVSQPTNMTVVQAPPKPDNNMGFAIFVCLCCNWICGLFGIYYASQSTSAYNATFDVQRSQEYARKAKNCSICGLVFGILSIILIIVVVILQVVVLGVAAGSRYHQ